jgi:hypothetical protein
MKNVNLPEEILLEIQDLLARINYSKMDLGEAHLAVSNFEKELENLKSEREKKIAVCVDLEEEKTRLVMRIVETYGEGDLDLNSGKYFVK